MRLRSAFGLAFVFCIVLRCAAFAQRATPIVLDTDIGGDIDDAFALALVVSSPELDLRAVTAVSGDTEARARIAAKMLWEAGKRDIPVAAGAPGTKMDISQAAWAEGFNGPNLSKESATDLMKREIDQGRGETVLVAVGPLTNVAALLKSHPETKKLIKRIVLMGGSIKRGYYPNSGPTSEYNIAADAAASQAVFSSGVPITMAPLDVTARLQIEGDKLQKVFAQSRLFGEALLALFKLWGQPVPTLHDPMAVSLLIDPKLCTRAELAVQVDEHGMTRTVDGRPANAMVAIEADPVQFIDFYVNRVAR